MNIDLALKFLPGLVVGLTVHEAAHAITAKWLGDRNPERMGRVSLNPFKHLSPLGTLVLFVLGFGWGRPVEVNLYNFKKPKLYYLLSSLAGPVSNLLISAISLSLLYFNPQGIIRLFLSSCCVVNLLLAALNLIPVPPLDGSKIWPCLFPKLKPGFSPKSSILWLILLVVALKFGIIGKIISPAVNIFYVLVPTNGYSHTRPENFPSFLKVPTDAKFPKYRVEMDPNDVPESYSVRYEMPRKYTPEEVKNNLFHSLADEDWNELEYKLYDPNIPSDQNWSEDKVKEKTYNVLWNTWVNSRDDIIVSGLWYRIDTDSEKPEPVYIRLENLASSSHQEWLRRYKNFHPEESE